MSDGPTGLVFDVKRLAVHDGPGIRTTVFLKGCSLRCAWCHNPESINTRPELLIRPSRCINCGACVDACPAKAHMMSDSGHHGFDRSRCVADFRCVEVCYAESLEMAGRRYTVDEVVRMVVEDEVFYQTSSGGVTLSGGEPLLQAEFAVELLRRLKAAGCHTAVDTSAHVPWSSISAALPHTDLFLVDLKHADSEEHRLHTGAGNERIVDNLTRLNRAGAETEIRIPIVPGVNDSPAALAGIGRLLGQLDSVQVVRLLPYLRLSGSKYESVGRVNTLPDVETPGEDDLLQAASVLSGASGRSGLSFLVGDRILRDGVLTTGA